MAEKIADSKSEVVHDEGELLRKTKASTSAESFVRTVLETDERVIARVTDGIYRQPGSALRELISNAYDADARKVVIKTDAPRFDRISVEDDGHGMSPEVLVRLIKHIGGSSKRSSDGQSLGIANSEDASLSPEGRKLIGKIGIGLFSVSQLTQSFQVITKTKGDDHRTIATIKLRSYNDSKAAETTPTSKDYESGIVLIWREKAVDIEVHGTTIILNNIRPQARDTLRSREIWNMIDESVELHADEEKQSIEPPRFHIGRVNSTGDLLEQSKGLKSVLPWSSEDAPHAAFKKLVDSVWNEIGQSTPNPKLETIFDYYLRMVWQLSLSIPVQYVEQHLFDESQNGFPKSFLISNKLKGSTSAVETSGKSLRNELALKDSATGPIPFQVFFDDLELARPLKFRGLPTTEHKLKHPLIFIGKYREEFSSAPLELSGGPLDFEAYLFWTPKIAPVEHQGVLVRINGASGTLFDAGFMRYQVSEQTRLRQTSCEIFIHEGLDSALNIDRESFNSAHPHAVLLAKWLHNALRQLASTQKREASAIREAGREETQETVVRDIRKVAKVAWAREMDPDSTPPTVELFAAGLSPTKQSSGYAYSRDAIVPGTPAHPRSKAKNAILEEKLKAIAQVLAAHGLLDSVPKKKQETLLRAIYEILEAQGE